MNLQEIKDLVFNTEHEELKQRSFILKQIKKNGYEIESTDDYGNVIPMTDDAQYIKVFEDGTKIGSLSFCDDGRISMFSCGTIEPREFDEDEWLESLWYEDDLCFGR